MTGLPTTPLGKTQMAVTRLGYGSMGLRGPNTWGVRTVTEKSAESMLHCVIDSGINFIDTSPDYGIAEQRIGRYLASRREEYWLATKCGCTPIQHDDHLEIQHTWTPEVIRSNVATSLKRMRTDRIDLLQFHGGSAATHQQDGLIRTLEKLRDAGTIRHLGVSTKLPEAERFLELGVFDVIQVPYSCLAPEHAGLIQRASTQGVGVIVRGGVAQGGPDAAIQREKLNSVWEQAKLVELLPESMLPAELILRHTLSMPACHTTIVGTCDPAHLAENIAAAKAGPLEDGLACEVSRRVAAVLSKPKPTAE